MANKTLKDILAMNSQDFNNLSKEDLKMLAKTLYSSVNRRLNSLQKSDIGKLSPVLAARKSQVRQTAKKINKQIAQAKKSAKAQGKRLNVKNVSTRNIGFSTKGRKRNQIIRDIIDAREIMQNELSTKEGIIQATKELETRLNLDKPLKESQVKRFWRLYNEIETHELNPNETNRGSTRIQEFIARQVASSRYIKNDEIIMEAQSLADDLYESKRELYNQWEEEQQYLDLDNEDEYPDDEDIDLLF